MDKVDIGLFDYDRYNTLYIFILNEDEQIYLRYGGRDSVSQDSYLNLDSLELALKKGLELHSDYQAGKLKKVERPKAFFPRDIAPLVERTYARNVCVECHLIGDFQLVEREEAGKLDKLTDMFRSPDIKTIGIHLDVAKGLMVKDSQGAAKSGGMQAGDRITALNGTTVWTFADLQYHYDKVPRSAKQIQVSVERDGKTLELPIMLPVRWWYDTGN
jgi:hypothetical protein